MPRRSNDFQRLIFLVEKVLASQGWRVTESKMVGDLINNEEVEVDVALESSVSGHPIMVAIECRACTRKQGKEWIRELAGKYEHLPVDKVIAVSRVGFSASVKALALHKKIDLLSLATATKADWPVMLRDLASFEIRFNEPTIESVRLEYSEDERSTGPGDLLPDQWRLADASGKDFGSLNEIVERIRSVQQIRDRFERGADPGTDGATGAKVGCILSSAGTRIVSFTPSGQSGTFEIECNLDGEGCLLFPGGTLHQVSHCTVLARMNTRTTRIPLSRSTYAGSAVAHGARQSQEGRYDVVWTVTPTGQTSVGVLVESEEPFTDAVLVVKHTDAQGKTGVSTFRPTDRWSR